MVRSVSITTGAFDLYFPHLLYFLFQPLVFLIFLCVPVNWYCCISISPVLIFSSYLLSRYLIGWPIFISVDGEIARGLVIIFRDFSVDSLLSSLLRICIFWWYLDGCCIPYFLIVDSHVIVFVKFLAESIRENNATSRGRTSDL